MESSPWLSPGFLLTAITTGVIVIAWFFRGEFKSNANAARQREFEGTITEYVDEVRTEHRELKKAFYAHATDTKVHHNEEAFKEFREGLNQRLTNFDNKLGELKTLIISSHKER